MSGLDKKPEGYAMQQDNERKLTMWAIYRDPDIEDRPQYRARKWVVGSRLHPTGEEQRAGCIHELRNWLARSGFRSLATGVPEVQFGMLESWM